MPDASPDRVDDADLSALDGRGARPHPLARLVVAAAVAAAAGLLTVRWFREAPTPPDFWFPHTAARLLGEGVNPYRVALNSPRWPVAVPNFFPLPAVVLAWPLAGLSLPAAGGVFVGAGAGALAWRVTRHSLVRALLFASGSFLMAARFGQWAPLLCLVALSPGAGWLAAAKPTVGAAMLVARASWRGVLGAVAFGAACLVVLPSWPLDWLAVLRRGNAVGLHLVPAATVWGWPLLLALLRWRRPEARLLVALACVPQMPMFYDQVALAFVARTRAEAAGLTAVNVVAWVLWLDALADWTPASQTAALPYWVLGTYLPALVLVLLKRNEGAVPGWLAWLGERLSRASRRGRPTAAARAPA